MSHNQTHHWCLVTEKQLVREQHEALPDPQSLESCCTLHKQASNMLLCDVLLKTQSKKYTIENQIPFSYETDF